MKLSEFKSLVAQSEKLNFTLPNGQSIPAHFHITEIGELTKKYVDCGGTYREEKKVSLQIWVSDDFWHRLEPQKLLGIIQMSEDKLGLSHEEVEVEFQGESILKYGLTHANGEFVFQPTQTTCLAQDACLVPEEKVKVKLSDLQNPSAPSCAPGSGCC